MALAALMSAALCSFLAAQTRKIDSLKMAAESVNDSIRAKVLSEVAKELLKQSKYEEAIETYQNAFLIYKKLGKRKEEATTLINIGNVFNAKGIYAEALNYYYKALPVEEEIQDIEGICFALNNIAAIFYFQKNYKEALSFNLKALEKRKESNDKIGETASLNNVGAVYFSLEKYDSARAYYEETLRLSREIGRKQGESNALNNIGEIYAKQGRFKEALDNYEKSLQIERELKSKQGEAYILNNIALIYYAQSQYLKSIDYLQQALKNTMPAEAQESYRLLSNNYEKIGDAKAALKYFRLYVQYKDSLFNIESIKKIAEIKEIYEKEKSEKQIELLKRDNDIARLENEKWRNTFIGLFGVFVIIGLFVSYRYNAKRRAEKLLQEKNAALEEKTKLVEEKTAQLAKAYDELATSKSEVERKNVALEKTLADLNATQQQLVQQEKLAALGELVAGVAHEIQNPLNFVNNFAELSSELCAEIADELKKTNVDFANIEALLADVESNLQKVSHHGKRASAIVKSMLEHSRKSSSEKEPTDLNALLHQYLKLTYQSYRMNHRGFNAQITTRFDDAVGHVAVMPREVSQVFVNIFNNAFYAMHEKVPVAQNGYMPELHVQTKKRDDKIEIRIRDNGVGISDDVKRKIFQPFFTTKKSGEGTGLGLSISNDVVKAHGGSISVESSEGEFAEFVITLPTK
jgi:C4-dicarboxylate-specific signal transduction histidine kinase